MIWRSRVRSGRFRAAKQIASRALVPRVRVVVAKGGAGFTLLELLAVLAILGLMVALVARYQPHWGKTLGLRGAAGEVAATLRLARSQAIAENRGVAVEFDIAGHRYRIGEGAPRPLPADLAIELVTIAGERQTGLAGTIRFNPDGSSTGGRVSLGDGQRRLAVGVDWLTGRVAVADVR